MTIEEPSKRYSDITSVSSTSVATTSLTQDQLTDSPLYLNLAETKHLLQRPDFTETKSPRRLFSQDSFDSSHYAELGSPLHRQSSAGAKFSQLPLSRQVLQNMRHRNFASRNWSSQSKQYKQSLGQSDSSTCYPPTSSGPRGRNAQFEASNNYLDVSWPSYGHSSHNFVQCHSAPHSPMHHTLEYPERSIHPKFDHTDDIGSKNLDQFAKLAFNEIHDSGGVFHRDHKYSFANSSSFPSGRRATHEIDTRYHPRSEKWGSLDCSTRRARSSTLNGYEVAYGRASFSHPTSKPAEVTGAKVRHSSANYLGTRNQSYQEAKQTSNVNEQHQQGASENIQDVCENRQGTSKQQSVNEKMNYENLITDEGQKKKIMSNYLVIRALLSSTDGKISEGASHPLLSINNV